MTNSEQTETPLPVDDDDEPEELSVSWAELFFDLVFVFAVTEVSILLRKDPTLLGVGHAVVAFVPIYWVWVGTCIFANTHGLKTNIDRIGLFAVGLGGMFMALAVPQAYGGRGILFGASYLAVRIILLIMIWRAGKMPLVSFVIGAFVSGPLMLAGGFLPSLPSPIRFLVWGVAAFADLSNPAFARKKLASARFAPGHLAERFGGFLIIALGESIVDIGAPAASATSLDVTTVVAVSAAFVLAAGLWWVYYAYAAGAVQHALSSKDARNDIIRTVLTYGHLVFIAAIIAVAVGMAEAVQYPERPLPWGDLNLLFVGCAVYLATFGYNRWKMFHTWSVVRLGGAAVVLALLPVAAHVPALIALYGLGIVVGAVNLTEYVLVRIGATSTGPRREQPQ
ncbi:MAG TPA: low temperature requirement protein A [Pseudonocardiaceae bacterium]|nr:low temperature requirement protein A [Pseudonocardiaceae bacterium]